jgi:hypothetical protein
MDASGYPTILVNGFERATDEVAAGFARGTLDWLPTRHQLVVVDRRDPTSLRDALVAGQFFPLST